METSVHRPHRLLLGTDQASSPPYNGDRTSDLYYNGGTNFNSNMIIVLAALLFAFIFALGLNSIAHCALVRLSPAFSPETRDVEAAASNTAASQIPEVTYELGLNILVTDCSICLGEFAQGEKVRVLPKCNHGFHVKCIDEWLWSHQSCPLCRQPILDQSAGRCGMIDAEEEEANATVQLPMNYNRAGG